MRMFGRIRIVILSTLAMTAGWLPSAQSKDVQFLRPKIPVEASVVKSRGRTQKVTLPKGLFKSERRKKLKHQEITLAGINSALKKQSRGTRSKFKALKRGQKIPVGNRPGARNKRKAISVEQYIKNLNTLAKKVAAAGFKTDGSGPKRIKVSRFAARAGLLAKQKARLSRSFGPIKPLKVLQKLQLPELDQTGSRGKKAYRLLGPSQYATFRPGQTKAKGRSRKPDDFKWEKKTVWGPYGAKDSAAVQIDTQLKVFANKDVVRFTASAGADSWIFNKKKTIFRALGRLGGDNRKGGGKGEVYARISMKILGKSYTILNKTAQGIQQSYEKSYLRAFTYDVRFAIASVPCTAVVGAAFKVGVRVQLNVQATRIAASVTPFIYSDVFASLSADAVVVAAGITGRMTLADAEANIHGEAGVAGDRKGLYAYANAAADLGLKALKGGIDGFVTVNWCIFGCETTYVHQMFGWPGFVKNWRLFKVEKKVYIVGPKKSGSSGSSSGNGSSNSQNSGNQVPVKTVVWERVRGDLSDIGVGADGTVWGVNHHEIIFQINHQKRTWKYTRGKLSRIAVGSAKHVWGVNRSDEIFQRSNGKWVKRPGKASKIAVGDDGDVWSINRQDHVFRWDGKAWIRMPGSMREIAVGSRKHIWAINKDDTIFRWKSSSQSWEQMNGKGRTLGVGSDGTVYVVKADGHVLVRAGQTWAPVPGKLTRISVGNKDTAWGVFGPNQVFRMK